MLKRGPKIKPIEYFKWSAHLAYAIGLLATDGNLSKDGRHIEITSKDLEQLENFKECLKLKVKISCKTSGYTEKKYTRIQFSDAGLYKFLMSVGLMPAKTKILEEIKIPKKYFFDFLRGHHDGDGSFYSYWDPRWKSSFMYYLKFISASDKHIKWLQREINNFIGVKGTINKTKNSSVIELRYAKTESLKILKKMYHSKKVICLTRKRLKIEKALAIVGESI